VAVGGTPNLINEEAETTTELQPPQGFVLAQMQWMRILYFCRAKKFQECSLLFLKSTKRSYDDDELCFEAN